MQVTVVGTDLSAATPLRLTAPDRLWSVPLMVTGQIPAPAHQSTFSSKSGRTNRTAALTPVTTLTAVADVPTSLPEAIVEAGTATGSVASTALPAEQK